jgi:hypothetical protein
MLNTVMLETIFRPMAGGFNARKIRVIGLLHTGVAKGFGRRLGTALKNVAVPP